MPHLPLRACSFPGCKNKVSERGDLFCEEHKKFNNKSYDKFGRHYNHSKRYGSRWTTLRNLFIKSHPLCEECLKENKTTPATIVHHIKPIEDGGEIFDINNLMSVCASCHQKIHEKLGRRY